MSDRRLTVGIFPSAGSVHLYHALDTGRFATAGLAVSLVEVRSSDEQIDGWDAGRFDVMHTSPDHLLGRRQRDPVAVRAEGIGELSVYLREGIAPENARWAVDHPASAFALVLRAILADTTGLQVKEANLVAVGGTRQRFQSLTAGDVDGTTLHPPFDLLAAERGHARVGGHLDVLPELITVAVVVPRREAGTDHIRAYLDVCRGSAAELLNGGPSAIAGALRRRGWDAESAGSAGEQMTGPAGLRAPARVDRRGLTAVAALRQRFVPDHAPSVPIESLLADEVSTDA
jgi:hypothetical protein